MRAAGSPRDRTSRAVRARAADPAPACRRWRTAGSRPRRERRARSPSRLGAAEAASPPSRPGSSIAVPDLDALVEGSLVARPRRTLRRLGERQAHRIGPVGAGAGGLGGLLVDVIQPAEVAEPELPDPPPPHAHGRILDPGVVEPPLDHPLEQRLEHAHEPRHLERIGAGDAAPLAVEIVELEPLVEDDAQLAVLD